jgi:hypothetical protein
VAFESGSLKMDAEYSFIGYNTNQQKRDVDNVFPDFLHTDGFTDTALFDYANTTDRGRDPRSVYRRNQWRRTHIAVLKGNQRFETGGIEIAGKVKYVRDEDFRSDTTYADDYKGNIYIARASLSGQVAEGFRVGGGLQVDRWNEQNRRGTLELGYGDDVTQREIAFLEAGLHYQGVQAKYYLEYIDKDQDREREPDQRWQVWRSKATIEVAW